MSFLFELIPTLRTKRPTIFPLRESRSTLFFFKYEITWYTSEFLHREHIYQSVDSCQLHSIHPSQTGYPIALSIFSLSAIQAFLNVMKLSNKNGSNVNAKKSQYRITSSISILIMPLSKPSMRYFGNLNAPAKSLILIPSLLRRYLILSGMLLISGKP